MNSFNGFSRKKIPILLMLIAGAITCVFTFIKRYSAFDRLWILLVVMVVFYFLGCSLKWSLDYFEKQNEQKTIDEGEVIEKEPESETDENIKKEEKEVK